MFCRLDSRFIICEELSSSSLDLSIAENSFISCKTSSAILRNLAKVDAKSILKLRIWLSWKTSLVTDSVEVGWSFCSAMILIAPCIPSNSKAFLCNPNRLSLLRAKKALAWPHVWPTSVSISRVLLRLANQSDTSSTLAWKFFMEAECRCKACRFEINSSISDWCLFWNSLMDLFKPPPSSPLVLANISLKDSSIFILSSSRWRIRLLTSDSSWNWWLWSLIIIRLWKDSSSSACRSSAWPKIWIRNCSLASNSSDFPSTWSKSSRGNASRLAMTAANSLWWLAMCSFTSWAFSPSSRLMGCASNSWLLRRMYSTSSWAWSALK